MAVIPAMMKAQVLNRYNEPYTLSELQVPVMTSPYDLLIKVEAAAYCHTDAACAAGMFEGHSNAPAEWPHVGCHEFAGTVVNISKVPSSLSALHIPSYSIGDRVGVPGRSFRPCGTCYECQLETPVHGLPRDPAGYSAYCPNAKNLGLSVRGGFAQYVVVDSRQVARLPPGMSPVEAAPLVCAGLTIYSALRSCQLNPGQRVAIIGCGGGLGHLGVQFAERMGLEVVGVDTSQAGLDLARQLSQETTLIDPATTSVTEAKKLLSGKHDGTFDPRQTGVDASIILPDSQRAFDYGIQLLKNHGKCVVVSFPKDGFHFSTDDVVFRQITIIGSLVGSNKVLHDMLAFARHNNIKSVNHLFPFSRLNDLVKQHKTGGTGKLVVDMSLESEPGF